MFVRRGQRKTCPFHESVFCRFVFPLLAVAKPFHRFAILLQTQPMSADIVLRGVNLLALRADERVALQYLVSCRDDETMADNSTEMYTYRVKLKFSKLMFFTSYTIQ